MNFRSLFSDSSPFWCDSMIENQEPVHIHDWDIWEIIKEGEIVRGDSVIGQYLDQRRRCKACGKHELDTQNSYDIED